MDEKEKMPELNKDAEAAVKENSFMDSFIDKLWVRVLAIILAAALLFGLVGHAIYLMVLEKRQQELQSSEYLLSSYNDFYNLAAEAIEREDYAEAAANLISCLEIAQPGSQAESELRSTLASIYMIEGQSAKALPEIERALSLKPGDHDLMLLKAQAELDLELFDSAVIDLEAYLELMPGDKEMLLTMAQLCESLEKYDKASYYYKNLFALDTQMIEYKLSAARCFILGGSCDKALQELAYFFGENQEAPGLGDARFLEGLCYIQTGDYPRAEESYLLAIDAGCDKGLCLQQLTACAFVEGRYQQALDYGRQYIELKLPEQGTEGFYQQMGVSAMAIEKFEEGIEYLSRSIELNADYPGSYYYRGLCELSSEKWEEARDDFSKSLEQGFMSQSSYYNRGLCHIQLLDYDKAIIDMERTMQDGDDKEIIKSAEELLPLLKEESGQN